MNFKKFILFNIKRMYFISLISAVAFLYLIPFSLYKTLEEKKILHIEEMTEKASILIPENSFIFILITLMLTISAVLCTFRYIYLDKVRANIIRNTLSRKKIFWGNIISSYITSVIPFVITFIVTLFLPFDNIISKGYIVVYGLKFLLLHLSIYAAAVFVTATVRTVVVQTVYIVVCMFIPLLLENVLSNTSEILLNGFVAELGIFGKFLRGFPIFTFVTNDYNFGIIKILITFTVSVVFIIGSSHIYINKPSVATRGYIRYKKLREFYRILFFVFFSLVSVATAKEYLFVIVLCALINVILCEFIIYGEIVVNKKQKRYFAYIAVFVIVYCIMRFDMYNIKDTEIYIDDVSDIYIGTNYYNINNLLDIADNEIVCDFTNIGIREFEKLDSDKINKFINYHNKVKAEAEFENREIPYVYMAYKLKNDKIIIRKYRIEYREFISEFK